MQYIPAIKIETSAKQSNYGLIITKHRIRQHEFLLFYLHPMSTIHSETTIHRMQKTRQ